MFRCLAFVLACGLAVSAGCSKSVKTLDDKDWENDVLQRVRDREDRGEIEKAMSMLNALLDEQPRQARAHLELAVLIQGYSPDPRDNALAIYHYRRYLDLRPGTEKRTMIETLIRKSEELFASAVSGKGDGKASDLLIALERENSQLKTKVAGLSARLEEARRGAGGSTEARPWMTGGAAGGGSGAGTVTTSSPGATGTGATPGGRRTYVVKNGDYLSRIADEVYGDPSKWTKLLEANKDVLGRTGKLRIGQVLVVPE